MSRAYGLVDYFVLAPATLADTIVDESRRHMLLGGVECALHTLHDPSAPVLVQYGDARRQLFAGVWVDMRAHFRCAYMWWPCVSHIEACTVGERTGVDRPATYVARYQLQHGTPPCSALSVHTSARIT